MWRKTPSTLKKSSRDLSVSTLHFETGFLTRETKHFKFEMSFLTREVKHFKVWNLFLTREVKHFKLWNVLPHAWETHFKAQQQERIFPAVCEPSRTTTVAAPSSSPTGLSDRARRPEMMVHGTHACHWNAYFMIAGLFNELLWNG